MKPKCPTWSVVTGGHRGRKKDVDQSPVCRTAQGRRACVRWCGRCAARVANAYVHAVEI